MTSTGVPPSPPVLAHDGDCGFCQASVDRIRAVAAPTLEGVPWQLRVVYRPASRNRRPMPASTAACAVPPRSS
ncbi:hypothetical protein ACIOHS_03935 [Streptomyces sp. NPDC088253]|uniref:hypothetical protein n=1 Tax=Streptomyces sp. NPDC088253 TaxID=3365846 RepID=UPI0038286A4E